MAATTISRTTWTDGAAGTLVDNAEKNSAIYDPIDSMIAAAITFGDTVSAEGRGDHIFSGSGTGANLVHVRNSTAGATNKAGINLGIDGDTDAGLLEVHTSSFTSSGHRQASGVSLAATAAGGLSLAADHASGAVRLYAAGTTKVATFDGDTVQLTGGDPGDYGLSGNIDVDTTSVGTDADTAEKTLYSFTVPASTLGANGQSLELRAFGECAANSNTKTLRVKFGSTTIQNRTLANAGTSEFQIVATVIRTGAATQKCFAEIRYLDQNSTLTDITAQYATAAETLSGTVDFVVTGQNGSASANDLNLHAGFVRLDP